VTAAPARDTGVSCGEFRLGEQPRAWAPDSQPPPPAAAAATSRVLSAEESRPGGRPERSARECERRHCCCLRVSPLHASGLSARRQCVALVVVRAFRSFADGRRNNSSLASLACSRALPLGVCTGPGRQPRPPSSRTRRRGIRRRARVRGRRVRCVVLGRPSALIVVEVAGAQFIGIKRRSRPAAFVIELFLRENRQRSRTTTTAPHRPFPSIVES
jgi:hypothetical protein